MLEFFWKNVSARHPFSVQSLLEGGTECVRIWVCTAAVGMAQNEDSGANRLDAQNECYCLHGPTAVQTPRESRHEASARNDRTPIATRSLKEKSLVKRYASGNVLGSHPNGRCDNVCHMLSSSSPVHQ